MKMDIIMGKLKENLEKRKEKDMVFRFGKMVNIMLVCGEMIKLMGMGSLRLIKEYIMKEDGIKGKKMAKENIPMKIKKLFIKEFGSMG